MLSAQEQPMTESPLTFAQLGIEEPLAQTLVELGYEQPTPIQEKTIPLLLAGRDMIGHAQTGTGKTAAFALPLLQKLDVSLAKPQAIILAPTRELAMQVAEAIHTYARAMGHVSVIPLYGGAPIYPQIRRLERGVQVIVGTPGRLIDHLERKTLDLSAIRFIVIDEADEMLRMGFIDDVEKILAQAPAEGRQVALFSATMPAEIVRISERHLRNPERITMEHHALTTPMIEQRFVNVSEAQKLSVLTQILELEPSEAVLIFRRTKTGAAELAEKLEARGFAAEAMHGDMLQAARESVIRRLRGGQIEIVVATDVAARGLDVESIAHVVNYDIPYDVEAYVHRIGRTGRAGRSGIATLFITPRERKMMREIERFTKTPIKPMKLPTVEDVAARRISIFKDTLRKGIGDGDLDLYVALVEQLAEEGPFDMAEIAAAAARLANASRPLSADAEEPVFVEEVTPRPSRAGRPPAPPTRTEPAHRAPRPEIEGDKVQLAIAIGKRDGIRPADIVGSIANEAGVPGREIGPIDIRDELTIVGLPERYKDQVIEKTRGARFRGRPLNVHVADAAELAAARPRSPRGRDDTPPPRREYAPRADSTRPPRREYTPRTDSTAPPRREYKPRDDSARPPRREYTPRTDSTAPPRREYKPRDDSAQPPRREYAPRTDSTAPPRREYAPRTDSTSAPRREYKPRDDSARPPRREYAPRTGAPPRRDDRAGAPAKRPYTRKPDDAPRREFAPRAGAPPRRDASDARPGAAPKRPYVRKTEEAPRRAPAAGRPFERKDRPAETKSGFYSKFVNKPRSPKFDRTDKPPRGPKKR
jgi:ATP-dependent RNA helicase DeaD